MSNFSDSSSKSTVTRRAVLAGACGAGLSAAGLTGRARAQSAETSAIPLDPVAGLPAGAPDRTLFTDSEQRYAPYLVSLAAMANDIVDDDDATYGYMAGGWWRTPSVPGNARIQEHVATLSWFLTHQRAWNPYYLDAALMARLDAAIGHYLSLQQSNGAFPVPNDQYSRATTGFGLVALASTVSNLRSESLLAARCAEIEQSMLAASNWFLNISGQWTQPISAVNQSVGGLVGVHMALDLVPDSALESALNDRIDFTVAHGQSPAGFFYEPFGNDIGYNFGVQLPDMADLYRLTGHTGMLTMAQQWANWFAYSWVREPDGVGSIPASASSARTTSNYFNDVAIDADRTALATLFLDDVPAMRAFFTSAEDRQAQRNAWRVSSDPVPGLVKGDTSPRILLHAAIGEDYPTSAQKSAAIAALPYLVDNNFVEVRDDPRNQHYVFVRKPDFYFAGYFGKRETTMVRSGPSQLWNPTIGTLIHSRNETAARQWDTILTDGTSSSTTVLSHSVTDGTSAQLTYQTSDGRISGVLQIGADLSHAITTDGGAKHTVPLLIRPGDVVTLIGVGGYDHSTALSGTATGLVLVRGGIEVEFAWGVGIPATLAPSGAKYFADVSRSLHMLSVSFTNSITMTTSITAGYPSSRRGRRK